MNSRRRRIIVYAAVSRYGPRASCQRKGLIHRIADNLGRFIVELNNL